MSLFDRFEVSLYRMVDNIGFTSEGEGLKYSTAGAAAGIGDDEVMKEQDRLLPIANVGRIMKQTLPPNAKISKEAKETMQECVSEFISFVTGEASDKCRKEKRKTVNGDDICWALGSLGFDDYAEPLRRYLHKFRELEGERSNHNKTGNNHEERDEQSNCRSEPVRKHTMSMASTKFNVIDVNSKSISRRF